MILKRNNKMRKIDGSWFDEKFAGWKWYKHTIWGI